MRYSAGAGSPVRVLEGHEGGVVAVCAVRTRGRTLLATGDGFHGTARLWDPIDGSCLHVLKGHRYEVGAVCAVQAGDRTLLATGGDDGTVRLWDPVDGRCALTAPVHHAVSAMAPIADSLAVRLAIGVLIVKFETKGFRD
jgi:WD40 repeat protein